MTPPSTPVPGLPTPTEGAATLSWVMPTTNTDGSVLTDLTGYRIVYGTSNTNLNTVINITNPSISTYIIDNLPANNVYYFAIKAYNSNGTESVLSNVISKEL